MKSTNATRRRVVMVGRIAPKSQATDSAEDPQARLQRLRHEAANTVMALAARPDLHPELMAWCEILETCDRALGNPATPARQMFAAYAYGGAA